MFVLAVFLLFVATVFTLISMLRLVDSATTTIEEISNIEFQVFVGQCCVVLFGLAAYTIRAWTEQDIFWFLYR